MSELRSIGPAPHLDREARRAQLLEMLDDVRAEVERDDGGALESLMFVGLRWNGESFSAGSEHNNFQALVGGLRILEHRLLQARTVL